MGAKKYVMSGHDPRHHSCTILRPQHAMHTYHKVITISVGPVLAGLNKFVDAVIGRFDHIGPFFSRRVSAGLNA